jgi:hypothetical protein
MEPHGISRQITRAVATYKGKLSREAKAAREAGKIVGRPLFMRVAPGVEGDELPRIGKYRTKRTAPVLPE